jgi:outer membrane protein OmpA-like peptidoglycan-associated protein
MRHFYLCFSFFMMFKSFAQNTATFNFKVGTIVQSEKIQAGHLEDNSSAWDTTMRLNPNAMTIPKSAGVIVNGKEYIGQNLLFYRLKSLNDSVENKDSIKIVMEFIKRSFPRVFNGDTYNTVYFYGFTRYNFKEASKVKSRLSLSTIGVYKSVPMIYFITNPPTEQGSITRAGKVTIINSDRVIVYCGPVLGLNSFKPDLAYTPKHKKEIKGKILTEEKGKKLPLSKTKVYSATDSTLTDEYGDFTLSVTANSSDEILLVKPSQEVKEVILATQSGQEISKLLKTTRGFEYKLLPAEIVRLSEVEINDDLYLVFDKFKVTSAKILAINENINYTLGEYKIDTSAYKVLNQVISVLTENTSVKLEIISHTDSQGDDAVNQQISDKRAQAVMNYLAMKGINKLRLKAIGKGESGIRNRCTNNVKCSDKEHGYNRRTEFKFTKQN